MTYAKHYLPNQIIVNLNDFLWTNPNNIMGIFSTAALFEAYCYTLWNSIGKSDYDYASLMEWVSEELGPNGNPIGEGVPLVTDTNFVFSMQQSVVCGFSNFVAQNQTYIRYSLGPNLAMITEQLLVAQDGVPDVMRLQYM